jgi:hypothetical protein
VRVSEGYKIPSHPPHPLLSHSAIPFSAVKFTNYLRFRFFIPIYTITSVHFGNIWKKNEHIATRYMRVYHYVFNNSLSTPPLYVKS